MSTTKPLQFLTEMNENEDEIHDTLIFRSGLERVHNETTVMPG